MKLKQGLCLLLLSALLTSASVWADDDDDDFDDDNFENDIVKIIEKEREKAEERAEKLLESLLERRFGDKYDIDDFEDQIEYWLEKQIEAGGSDESIEDRIEQELEKHLEIMVDDDSKTEEQLEFIDEKLQQLWQFEDDLEESLLPSLPNQSLQTFNIRGQVIDYSEVTGWDLEGATLADGLRVEVEGKLVGNIIMADEIEAEDEVFEKGTKLEIKCIVSAFNEDAKTFEVNGTKVTWNNNTDFDDMKANQLTNGLLVEVEGRVNAEGVLVAEEIKLEDDANISIEATISEVTAGKDKFSGTLTILGIQVKVDMNTRMRDDTDNPNFNPMFNFSDINAGDKVELDITGDATNG